MENLKTSFGKSKVSQSQKTKMVQDVFSDITKQYDLMNNLMSFGTHRLWKKKLVQQLNIQPDELIIDVGAGTGDIANLIHNNYSTASIISIDLNLNMLKYGKEKIKHKSNKISWVNCNAENLPFNIIYLTNISYRYMIYIYIYISYIYIYIYIYLIYVPYLT